MPTEVIRLVPYRVGRSRTGLGLFAGRTFKRGERIVEYIGERIPTKLAAERVARYDFETSSRWTIDGSPRWNIARYINHACKPNAKAEIVRGRIFIKALRRIEAGEEITYNYGKGYFETFIEPKGCLCEACGKAGARLSAAGR